MSATTIISVAPKVTHGLLKPAADLLETALGEMRQLPTRGGSYQAEAKHIFEDLLTPMMGAIHNSGAPEAKGLLQAMDSRVMAPIGRLRGIQAGEFGHQHSAVTSAVAASNAFLGSLRGL
jgi:hypothetical protein